jgi:hypothetical protein
LRWLLGGIFGRPPPATAARTMPSCPLRLLSLKARTIRSRRTGGRPHLLRQDSRGCWKLTRPGAMSQSRLTRSWSFGFQHGGVDGQSRTRAHDVDSFEPCQSTFIAARWFCWRTLTRTPLIQSFRSLALGRADAEAASEIGMPRAVGLARRWNFDYKSKIFLDYVTNIKYILPSSLMEGRLRTRS